MIFIAGLLMIFLLRIIFVTLYNLPPFTYKEKSILAISQWNFCHNFNPHFASVHNVHKNVG